jgi:hypothetical protein
VDKGNGIADDDGSGPGLNRVSIECGSVVGEAKPSAKWNTAGLVGEIGVDFNLKRTQIL